MSPGPGRTPPPSRQIRVVPFWLHGYRTRRRILRQAGVNTAQCDFTCNVLHIKRTARTAPAAKSTARLHPCYALYAIFNAVILPRPPHHPSPPPAQPVMKRFPPVLRALALIAPVICLTAKIPAQPMLTFPADTVIAEGCGDPWTLDTRLFGLNLTNEPFELKWWKTQETYPTTGF